MTTSGSIPRAQELLGQTVVVIGGSAGIGLETARRARSEGAQVVLAARDPQRLAQAALDVGAESTATLDATDLTALKQFFDGLPGRIDHVMLTGPGPRYGPMLEQDSEAARVTLSDHITLPLEVARNAVPRMRPGATLIFMGGTGGRRISRELGLVSAATAALPPFIAALALEIAPVRVNLIAAGFIDTPLSASYFATKRRSRQAPRATASDAPDRPGGRTSRRRRARRPHHDQHGPHRRHLRHRRGTAVRPVAKRATARKG